MRITQHQRCRTAGLGYPSHDVLSTESRVAIRARGQSTARSDEMANVLQFYTSLHTDRTCGGSKRVTSQRTECCNSVRRGLNLAQLMQGSKRACEPPPVSKRPIWERDAGGMTKRILRHHKALLICRYCLLSTMNLKVIAEQELLTKPSHKRIQLCDTAYVSEKTHTSPERMSKRQRHTPSPNHY